VRDDARLWIDVEACHALHSGRERASDAGARLLGARSAGAAIRRIFVDIVARNVDDIVGLL
jgi:hypothetical protein